MIILEIIIGYNFYKFILLNNKIGLFQISFIFINIIYKRIYKKLIIVIFMKYLLKNQLLKYYQVSLYL